MMEWSTLLSSKRAREYTSRPNRTSTDLRSEFEKDYHRIIGSASFRRLQDKTQVYPLDQSDFIRTRLTHSLEVSSFAKSLGQNIGENILQYKNDSGFTHQMKEDICNILQCAGLIHDIGNPPFGHFGELAIREWFVRNISHLTYKDTTVAKVLNDQMQADFYNFEGNAQALRLVTKLHHLVDEHGMNLTYALLNTIIKYPVSSTQIGKDTGNIKDKKMGYYYADEDIFRKITAATKTFSRRHPLTYILEAADDLAYKTADVEDGFVKGFISYHDVIEELRKLESSSLNQRTGGKISTGFFNPLETLKKLYQRGCDSKHKNPEDYAIKNWIVRVQGFLIGCATFGFTSNYDRIMAGTYEHDLFHDTFAEPLLKSLGDMAYKHVFTSHEIYKMEVSGQVILNFLMDKLVTAALHFETDVETNSLGERIMVFFSENYVNAYRSQREGKNEAEQLYLRLLLVTDFVCGMTDGYAKRLYQEFNGIR